MYMLVALLLLYNTGRVLSYCPNCEPNACNMDYCESCSDGYYSNSNGYCSECRSSHCLKCNRSIDCSECDPGYHGSYCQYKCNSGCIDDVCFKDTGKCVHGCKDKYYLQTNGFCGQCIQTCSKCTSSSTCSECSLGKYGRYCMQACSGCTYNQCDISSGACTWGCNDGYYLESNGRCSKCKLNCHLCQDDDDCTSCVTGWWGSYCQYSCQGCKYTHLTNYCMKTSGCKYGCSDGFFQISTVHGKYCASCPHHCITCTDINTCLNCEAGYNGTKCQFNCRHCNGDICNRDTGNCIFNCEFNQYFDGTAKECKQCPSGCTACTSTKECTACATGRWGHICNGTCNQNCKDKKCRKSNGNCINGCNDGFYGPQCSSSCLLGCKSCTNQFACTSCKDDYFSKNYYAKCECADAYCTFHDAAQCTQCSTSQWYPHESGCCPCNTDCINSTCFSNKTCMECSPGRHGDQCQSKCNSNCRDSLCYRDGACISCPDNRYGPECKWYCFRAITNCNKCYAKDDNPVTCTGCFPGWYVENNRCIRCHHCKSAWPASKCNTTTGSCTVGCTNRYYGDKCDSMCNVTNCLLCPTDPNVCQECKDSFYVETDSVCTKCSANCQVGTNCNKFNGSCTAGCIAGWSGEMCNQQCLSGCKSCNQFNSSLCDVCLIGLYGNECERTCSSNCKRVDVIQVCNKTNGHCEHGCKYGFWGYACENSCGAGCNGSFCNRTSGVCKNGCKHEYYGVLCTAQCSKHCVSRDNDSAERSCHNETGDCLLGCLPGWFGGTCERECSKQCNGTICHRNNGTCTFGCIEGYIGPSCSQARVRAEEDSTDTTAIGAGAGAGVAFLVIIVVVAAVIFWRRRRRSSKLAKHDSTVAHVSPGSQQTNTDLVYSNVDDRGIRTEGPGKTGVSNLLYANVRMSDVSKEEETNATYELARPINEDYLKEEEIIDGELTEDFETDAGEVDSTYYNVAGKRVSVAHLAEYVRNKKREEIYADFQRIPKGLLKDYREAKKAKNVHKNKYRSIYPYDESRVILQDGGSDYMNASYIEGFNSKREYIASSGPFKKSYDTTPDFWRMIWQEKCENIVMLTNPFENGETKCIKYWPEPDGSNNFGKIQVTTLTEDRYSDVTIRIFTLTQGDESFNVRHLHFTAWPDKGVPHDVTSMIEFRQKVRSLHKDKNCPLLVHCSAGIGRTGTFIALDMLTYEGENRGSVDIFGCVAALRSQRCNLVQTKDQYDYLHHAVLHSLTFDCRSIAGDMFLQNYNKLIEKNGGKRIIDKQFEQLQSTNEEMTAEDKAEVTRNQSLPNKNRDGADIPVDEYRVKLHENRKPGAIDYINAVWINGFRTRHKFIIAQTPLPSTVVDFLTLVHQEKCSCIVMMEEADITNKTVGVYWPADNQSIKHGVFKISCKDSMSTQHYAKKTLSITCHGPKGEEIHDVQLFIFTTWSKGNDVPKTSDSVIQLVKSVDDVSRSKDKESTILVHCMTGSERSCVYCAVSILIEKMEIEHEVSVVNTLRQIKARRRSAFQSLNQYKFCHQAVISYLQSFDIYSNFGLKDSEASNV